MSSPTESRKVPPDIAEKIGIDNLDNENLWTVIMNILLREQGERIRGYRR